MNETYRPDPNEARENDKRGNQGHGGIDPRRQQEQRKTDSTTQGVENKPRVSTERERNQEENEELEEEFDKSSKDRRTA